MNNIYKYFRHVPDVLVKRIEEPVGISKRYDEPTYLSFRLRFAENLDEYYNTVERGASYDKMPHPLFFRPRMIPKYDPTASLTTINATQLVGLPPNVNPNNTDSVGITRVPDTTSHYSAIEYLQNANEPTRAAMLLEFIEGFNTIQDEYPYYFQSIEGVNELLSIFPSRGQRISSGTTITIKCLESLDLRMSYLMNLYRKIVWDDIYQRWVLPDMMRYFTLDIYISEFRTFHKNKNFENNGQRQNLNNEADLTPLYLEILDDVLPTWQIKCEMCEFDISNIAFEALSNLSVADDPAAAQIKIPIKVGNIKELQIYPLFKNGYLVDRKINGRNRADESVISTSEDDNKNLYPISLQVAQNREGANETNQHISGMPYNERANENTLDEAGAVLRTLSGATLNINTDPNRPDTWVGNTATMGVAFAKSFVNRLVDKSKMIQIPGLGVSFTEIKTALESKNVVTAFGMIRKGINEVIKSYSNAPSSRLEQPMQTEELMRDFVTTVAQLKTSTATDNETAMLVEAANIVLSERGIWEKIRDYSLATDITGPGEVNIEKTLYGTEQYSEAANVASGLTERVTGDAQLPQVEPNRISSGHLEQENLQQMGASQNLGSQTSGDKLTTTSPSSQLGNIATDKQIIQNAPSEQLTNDITANKITTITPSNLLSNEIQITSGIKQGDSGLQNTIIHKGTIFEGQPSSMLNTKITGEKLTQPKVNQVSKSNIENEK